MALFLGYLLMDVVTGAIVLLLIVYFYFKYKYQYWKRHGIKYIEPSIPFGNFGEPMRFKQPMSSLMLEWYGEMKAKGERHFGVYFFHNPFFVPVHLELVKSILVRDFLHFYDRGVYVDEENDPLSAHLIALEGQRWKNLRNKLSPTFTSGKMKKMFQNLVDCTNDLKTCLDEFSSKSEPVDIRQTMALYTTDVIGSCAFGIDCNSFKNPESEFVNMGKKVFQQDLYNIVKVTFAMSLPKVASFFKLKLTNPELESFYMTLVKETVRYREENKVVKNDFMQLLIQLKNDGYIDELETENEQGTTLTINDIVAHSFLFFIAGYETSSNAMAFTLYELGRNQDIQESLREEIINVLKKHDGKITYEAIAEMNYLERVIQESLRLHPIFPILQRVCTKDYDVPETSFVLKRGMFVFIPVVCIHMDPEYYPDPHRFDPERFTDQNKAARPDYTFIPFGEGPRMCIGLRFAMLQMKVGLCRLLMNYKFSVNAKTQHPLKMDPASVTALAIGGLWLDVERIN